MNKLGIIDYGAGNLSSVCNSFLSVGVSSQLVRHPEDLAGLTHLVLPGVGAFGDCARALHEQGLDGALRDWIAADLPFLGICVGYQILFESSEESPGIPGLGIFAGHVRRFPDAELKVPHMGWNEVHFRREEDPLWAGMGENRHFYFVHSYYPEPEQKELIAADCCYGVNFAAAIRRGKLVATQFHPEKSQKLGLQLLRNFADSPA